jgi:heavy metal sensor kinase
VLAIVLIVFSLTLYDAFKRSQFSEFENILKATSDIVKTKVEESQNDMTPDIEWNEIPLREELYIQVTRFTSPTTAGIAYQTPNLSLNNPLDITAPIQDALQKGHTYFHYTTSPDGKKIALVSQLYSFGLSGILQVGAPFSKVQQTLNQLQFWLWIVVPITLVLTSFGGIFLADRLLHPLSQMNDSAREISGNNLNHRLPVSNPNDELGRLAITLNEMFDRLEKAFRNQQRFIADASHELRTPMAAMRAEIEVALRRERDKGEYKDLIFSNLDEVKRLSHMAERLLFLTQSDAGKLPLREESVSLNEVCQEVHHMLTPLAKQRKIELNIDDITPSTVCGDGELLKQLLIILAENAIKYSPDGSQVFISCGEHVKEAWVAVKDNGPGIPQEHIPHLFERFYRVDKARSREYGGAGLGLSIAHSIIFAHQGRIDIDSSPDQGTAFRVYLPFS